MMKQRIGDFSRFDRRARAAETLQVVFLGGSLTWGARATDPQLTSYRALLSQRLQRFYPKAHFTFWDAAIGGTGSQLAIFRLRRDVLRRKPDLVFLDFTVNDDPYSIEEPKLASYESLIRRLILEGGVPIVQALFAAKRDVEPNPPPRPRDEAHKAISQAYGTGLGDAVAWMRKKVREGRAEPDALWPYPPDATHPGDKGYALYAEAVWKGFREAVNRKRVCRAPKEMIHAATGMKWTRQRLSRLSSLPKGWTPGLPMSQGVAFDFYMSRWLDDVTIARFRASSLRLRFQGSFALLLGEATPESGKFQVMIDGNPAVREGAPEGIYNAQCPTGCMHLIRLLAEGLDPTQEHLLELVPLLDPGQELRIESLCVAGGSSVSMA